jgi:hypothetical protein
MKIRQHLAFVAFLLIGTLPLAAQKTITGTVTDQSGAPLTGVTVAAQGSKTAVYTDIQGRYTLSLPDDKAGFPGF